MHSKRTLVTSITAVTAFLGGFSPAVAQAGLFNQPEVPLIVSIETIPNIWFQMDDSGSMDWEVLVPQHFTSCRYDASLGCNTVFNTGDGIMQDWRGDGGRTILNFEYMFDLSDSRYGTDCSGGRNSFERCAIQFGQRQDWRAYSAALNVQYFDPTLEYAPWRPSSDTFTNANFTSARSWPVPGEAGYGVTRDLTGFVYNWWIDDKGFAGGQPDRTDVTIGPNDIVDQWDSHVRVTVNAGSFSCELVSYSPNAGGINPSSTDITGSGQCAAATANLTAAELSQRVANWFQYYRRRTHVARAAVGEIVTDLPEFRYGLGHINRRSTNYPIPTTQITDYEGNNRGLLDLLYGKDREALGTPLREGLRWVGRMYAGDIGGNPSPYTEYCQKAFSIVFSDGFWNGNLGGTLGDHDGDGVTLGGSGNNRGTTLADVAQFYWETDLRTDLADGVPTDFRDTANWQHMVTYTVAFGLEGALTDGDSDGWPDPPLDKDDNWYPGSNNQDRVDDMWHAAWNSAGSYFNASSPQELVDDVRAAVTDIARRIGGAASAAANSGSISSESRVFQAKFDTADWHGELLAIPVNDDGTLAAGADWDANAILNTKSSVELASNAAGRDVWTWNDDSGTPIGTSFSWSAISAAQKALLNLNADGIDDGLGPERLSYIRGDSREETQNGGPFRERFNKLGDIVNSDPTFVGFPPFFYPFDNYQGFFTANQAREPMIYVGANDGMFHAIRESDGEAVWAYVPDAIIGNLPKLTDPDYEHTFFVDGPPSYGDVQIGGAWHSVVASGLRSGGQAVFALDVTDPTPATSPALWEFSDEDDPDLGYTYSQPQIKLMANGKWAAIIGNGLNNTEADGHASTTGEASIFILFIEDGMNGWAPGDYVKIPVPGGSDIDPNAMFTPAAADIDGDSKVDFIYAGDKFGKLWKFDVSDANPASWGLAFGSAPLFDAGPDSPITDRPAIAAHPAGRSLGQLVTFGTGQFIEGSDNIATGYPQQTIYAVWDFDTDWADSKALTASERYGTTKGQMFGTTMSVQTLGGESVRVIDSAGEVSWLDGTGKPDDRGWYIDLPIEGERVVRRPVLRDDLVFLTSLIPDDDPCAAGGSGWIMVFDIGTGVAPTFPVFDIDGDRDVTNEGDIIDGDDADPDNDVTPVGISSPSIPNLPALIYDDRPNFSASQGRFPPAPNVARGCEAGQARAYTFTTGSNGAILAVETATQTLSCGRQNWRGER